MIPGKIIKGVGGLYHIAAADKIYACGAAGIFRLKKITPVIGDNCEFIITDETDNEGSITNILPRKNEITRPRVSNIDLIIVVAAFAEPAPDLMMLDKYLVFLEDISQNSAEPFEISILLNKRDLAAGDIFPYKEHYKSAGYNVIYTSSYTGEGFDELLDLLRGRTSVLAGASGVGKSSIVNRLAGDKNKMETGALSQKIARGKHTTRHVELLRLDTDTYLTDTPGFTSITLDINDKTELQHLFPEFEPFFGACGFNDCAHINELKCAVKEQIGKAIREQRYESYAAFYSLL